MFSGDYLTNNIGHEIINLFKDDDGESYVYLLPLGTFGVEHKDRIQYVFHTQTVPSANAQEVIALSLIDCDVYNPTVDEAITKQNQADLCSQVYYGGVSLAKIFSANTAQQEISISLHATWTKFPKKKIFITWGNSPIVSDLQDDPIIVEMEGGQPKSSLKAYYPLVSKLGNLANDPNLWGDEIKTVADSKKLAVQPTFFDVCGIENYELAFSNAFAYFMDKYPELVVEFANRKFNKPFQPFTTIYREKDRIDIWMENNSQVVVIENKIKSDINGKKGNQLENYYNKAQEYCKEHDKTACYILLLPDYNKIKLSKYTVNGKPAGDVYQEIRYSEVYDFLESVLGRQPYRNDAYLREFVNGLFKHTKAYDNSNFVRMYWRFMNRIHRV